ncbi:MAG: signal peptidase I [Tenericutes bacterium]|nr:signal peptidase I [Mycoplasmatota bacterium]
MIKTLGKVLSYFIILALLANIVVSIFMPERSMELLGYRTFTVLSKSMEPKINVNDVIVLTSANKESLEVGDIITFSVYIPEFEELSFVTHYIAAIEEVDGETIFKTQGEGRDASEYDNWQDEEGNAYDITFNDIEGEYVFKIPFVGTLAVFLSNPIFLSLVIINLIVLYSTYRYIKSVIKEKKIERKVEGSNF